MMIFPRDFARLAEASGGRLRLEAAPAGMHYPVDVPGGVG